MRYYLRPLPPPHRARIRLTLATILLPILGFVALTRLELVRSPLGEREAALAVDLRSAAAVEVAGEKREPGWTATTLALVSRMPNVAGNRELQLRLAGIVCGALALGVAARLGTRLFAPRVGTAVGLLLLATSVGRRLLGAELGSEPIYLLAMLCGLLAMRNMVERRVAALWAGVACGIAIAVAGLDSLWLPVLGVFWLRHHQGLTIRSATALLGTTLVTAAVALAAGWLLAAGRVPPPVLDSPLEGLRNLAYLDPELLRLRPAARELLPLAPLFLLGLATMRAAWWRSASFRFLFLWAALSGLTWAATGAAASFYVAALYAITAIALLGVEHASRRLSLPALAVAAALALALWPTPDGLSDTQSLDRWAIREAGRFVGRVIHAGRRLAASPHAAKRFAFYGNRPVQPFTNGTSQLGEVDYVILPRADFRILRAADDGPSAPPRPGTPSLKRIAEFGSWVVARVGERRSGRPGSS